jgi:hypothetical protein
LADGKTIMNGNTWKTYGNMLNHAGFKIVHGINMIHDPRFTEWETLFFFRGFMGNMWHGLSPTRGGISMSRGGFWHENRPCRKQKYRDFPMFQLRTHWTKPILLNPIPIIESSLVGDIPKIVPVDSKGQGLLKIS